MQEQLNAFLEFLQEEQHYSQNTIAAYHNDLGQFLKFMVEEAKISDWPAATETTVQAYVDGMKHQPYASSSIARKVAAVKSFFHFLFARGFIQKDVTTKLESPKVKKRKPQTLTHDEVDRLLASPTKKKAPKNLRDAALLGILYATGMRVTEVVTLTLQELDLENSTLHCHSKDGQTRDLPFDDHTHKL